MPNKKTADAQPVATDETAPSASSASPDAASAPDATTPSPATPAAPSDSTIALRPALLALLAQAQITTEEVALHVRREVAGVLVSFLAKEPTRAHDAAQAVRLGDGARVWTFAGTGPSEDHEAFAVHLRSAD